MAELAASSPNHPQAGVKKSKKLPTRVDLTPMVDLGFLLITFFVFTTTMTQPAAMRLVLPDDSHPERFRHEPNSAVITILAGKNNSIFYYEGADPSRGKIADGSAIRSIILDKKRRTDPAWFEVVLKPSPDCTYGATVNLLDEMKIDAVRHYALVDMTPYEYKILLSPPGR
ncbi:MAG TPA: biopolymer transporter ExbD [Puia sp.]|nr:biopolymer transporter ExbD [Puia sp.]